MQRDDYTCAAYSINGAPVKAFQKKYVFYSSLGVWGARALSVLFRFVRGL